MAIKLIGWPLAGLALQHTSHTIGQSDLSSVILACYTEGILGDITGKGTGKGKPKRSKGTGPDHDAAKAARLAQHKADLPFITAMLASEHDLGNRLMTLAGGEAWQSKGQIGLNSSGCAARAARYVRHKRGKFGEGTLLPSDATMNDAASDAASAMFQSVRQWDKVRPEHWTGTRLVPYLFRVGWRAAFKSITSTGFTGNKASQSASLVPLESAGLEIERKGLEHWAQSNGFRPISARDEARQGVACFVWRTIMNGHGQGHPKAKRAARARARFIMRLVYSDTIADAASFAGFASARAAVKSIQEGKIFDTLRAAAKSNWQAVPNLARLASRARAAGLAAGKLWRELSSLPARQFNGTIESGTAGFATRTARHWMNKATNAQGERGRGALVESVRQVPCVIYGIGDAARTALVVKTALALGKAKRAKARLAIARLEHDECWRLALNGWRKGWLR